jgi:hypothetical protein
MTLCYPPRTVFRDSYSPEVCIYIILYWIQGLSGELHSVSKNKKKKTPWSESASELYRPSDRRLLAKRLPTCAERGCHAVSVTDPYGRILGFLERSRYFSLK